MAHIHIYEVVYVADASLVRRRWESSFVILLACCVLVRFLKNIKSYKRHPFPSEFDPSFVCSVSYLSWSSFCEDIEVKFDSEGCH